MDSVIHQLPQKHRNAIMWFNSHRGTQQTWPDPLPDGTLLATKAKGIYKPSWSKYALSIRQMLRSQYPDREPRLQTDGSWTLRYFQENTDPSERDDAFTNRGLLECSKDGIPVGVMRQVASNRGSTYEILGLALVTGWENGYFILKSSKF